MLGFDTEHTRFASKYNLYLYREEGVNPYSQENIGVGTTALVYLRVLVRFLLLTLNSWLERQSCFYREMLAAIVRSVHWLLKLRDTITMSFATMRIV